MTPTAEKAATVDVAEWRRAMEGVTPGPWYSEAVETEGSYGSGEDATEGFDSYVVRTEAQKHYGDDAVVCDALNSGTAEVHEEFNEDGTHAWDEPGRCAMAWIARCSPTGISELLGAIEAQARELTAARAEIERLREALGPFRWLSIEFPNTADDFQPVPGHSLTFADFRRARTALAKEESGR